MDYFTPAALDYIVKSGTKPAVASMSLSGGAYEVLDDAVRGMIAAGVPTVVAAGNSYSNACYSSPARVTEVSLHASIWWIKKKTTLTIINFFNTSNMTLTRILDIMLIL